MIRGRHLPFTIVLRGALVVESEGGQMTVQAGQGVHTRPGEWVRYSTPGADGAEYISVCVPALNEAATIGATVRILAELRERGAIDQVVVVDGASTDDTARIAAEHGAEVHQQDGLLPQLGPVLGKGDAMWRALTVLEGDLVCFVDADSEDFAPHFPCGLLGPLLFEEGVEYVKGFYRRPFKSGTAIAPQGGGRVTELTARPLLEVFYPELAACRQPLAGEIAAPRSLLERLPWATGYGARVQVPIFQGFDSCWAASTVFRFRVAPAPPAPAPQRP